MKFNVKIIMIIINAFCDDNNDSIIYRKMWYILATKRENDLLFKLTLTNYSILLQFVMYNFINSIKNASLMLFSFTFDHALNIKIFITNIIN